MFPVREREALLYQRVTRVNPPIFRGARVPLPRSLNLNKWQQILQGYHKRDLFDLLKFGFPFGFVTDAPPPSATRNHPSANHYRNSMLAYRDKEKGNKVLLGLFPAHHSMNGFTCRQQFNDRREKALASTASHIRPFSRPGWGS